MTFEVASQVAFKDIHITEDEYCMFFYVYAKFAIIC